MLKKVAIGIGIVAALLLLAGVAAALLIDVNRFKPTLERMVTDATGRKLTIDGPLSLRMFPRLGIAVPKSTLSGPGGDGAFASLSSASVAVAWLPLLTGRVVVDQVNVNGLQAALERRADGRSNIDDLLQRRKAEPKASSDAESSAISVSIRGISLNDANLSLRSADGSTIALTNLNLEIDDIAAADYKPVRISSSVKSSKPALVADLALTAEMLVDAANSRYGVRDLEGSAKGTLAQQPMEVKLAAARAAWQANGVEGEKLVFAVTSQGPQRLEVRVTGDEIKGKAPSFEATIAATFKRDAGSQRTEGKLTSPLRANLDAMTFEFLRLVADVSSPHPTAPQKAIKLSLSGTGSVDLKRELVALKLKSGLDDTHLAGSLDIRGFERPRIAFDVSADQLDLDRHFPPAAASVKPAASAASSVRSRPADAKVDLSALRDLQASGSARIGKLRVRGVDATDVRLTLQATDGKLDVAPLTARLYEGTVNAKLSARAEGNRIGGTGQIAGLALKPLMAGLGNSAKLEGKTDLKFDLSTSGETTDALRKHLDGSLSLAVRDGAIRGIDVVETLTGALGFIAARKTHAEAIDDTKMTRFSSLTASAQIDDGIATSKDLQATSAVLKISGSGRLNLVEEELDYVLRAQMTASPLGADKRIVSSLLGYTVPIHLTGPLDSLSYRVDWVAVGADMVTRRTLGGVGTPVIEEAVKGLGGLLGGKKNR